MCKDLEPTATFEVYRCTAVVGGQAELERGKIEKMKIRCQNPQSTCALLQMKNVLRGIRRPKIEIEGLCQAGHKV